MKECEHESENQQVVKNNFPHKKAKMAPSSRNEGIKLKGCVMLATKPDLAENFDNDMPCDALICKDALSHLQLSLYHIAQFQQVSKVAKLFSFLCA